MFYNHSMLDHEYKRRTHPEYYRRSWPFTIITALLAIFVLIGIVSSWRYIGHDAYVIGSVIVPAVIIFLLLCIVALNGRKHVIKDAYVSILEFIFWWRP